VAVKSSSDDWNINRADLSTNTIELVADGRVTVTGGGDQIKVHRSERYAFTAPTHTADVIGGRLTVSNTCSMQWFFNCTANLDVTVPADFMVLVHTSTGEVTVSGVPNDVQVQSSNGNLILSDLTGVTAETSNGAITAERIGGGATLRTSNGKITARDIGRDLARDMPGGTRVGEVLSARTSDGAVVVEGVRGGASVRTSNSSVTVSGVTGDIDASSSNGPVTVYSNGVPVRLVIDTSNGKQTVQGATDPDAVTEVRIHSSNGAVSYLAPQK
jgi:hypothetical protein